MYDSLTTDDEPEIHSLMERGMKMEDAVLAIFERKYVHQQAPPSRQNSNHYYSSATTNTHHSSSQFSLGSNGYSPAVPTSANQGFNPPPLVHSYRGGSMSSMPLPYMPSTYSVHSATVTICIFYKITFNFLVCRVMKATIDECILKIPVTLPPLMFHLHIWIL